MNQKVTVIGAGRMGSALATALHNRGFDTTVWNRTSSKTEPLSRLGLRVAPGVLAAVGNAEIVVVNVNNYESTNQLIRQPAIEAALADLCEKIQGKDYENTQASLETWAVAPRELIGWCEKHRVDHTFADPQLRLIERAVKAGKGQLDLAYLYEVLKQGAD
ncbi:MAG: NAD(P)-binding domain-containing protein [Terriglobales bacterium]|jgi:glutamyl-tRNA reductase